MKVDEDVAARLDAATANPPDAWYAVPDNVILMTTSTPATLLQAYPPTAGTYQLLASKGMPDPCTDERCAALAEQWGM